MRYRNRGRRKRKPFSSHQQTITDETTWQNHISQWEASIATRPPLRPGNGRTQSRGELLNSRERSRSNNNSLPPSVGTNTPGKRRRWNLIGEKTTLFTETLFRNHHSLSATEPRRRLQLTQLLPHQQQLTKDNVDYLPRSHRANSQLKSATIQQSGPATLRILGRITHADWTNSRDHSTRSLLGSSKHS